MAFTAVDAHFFSLRTNQIANGANKQRQILINHRWRLNFFHTLVDRLAKPVQIFHVGGQIICAGGFCGGTDDVAALNSHGGRLL